MKKMFQKLVDFILDENRDKAVLYALKLLEDKKIDIVTLYEEVLSYSLNTIDCDLEPEECIWKEHVKTAIVRSIIEAVYPYVIKEKQFITMNGKNVLVVCPSEEYHEIGAKMAHDFFLLCGYKSTFVGANTPLTEILNAIKYLSADSIAISVTNYYNVITAKKVISRIKSEYPHIQIFIGGYAFNSEESKQQVSFDKYLTTFQSIKDILG